MKEMIIIAIVAFYATAWVMDTGAPAKPVKAGIDGLKASSLSGMRKQDEMLGDFRIKDGYRSLKMRTHVLDDNDPRAAGSRNDSDFPLSGGTSSI
jgi:hypothetical protein